MPTGKYKRIKKVGGWKLSKEVRKRMSEIRKGKMPKFIPDNKGIVRTANSKKKISDTLKKKGIKPPSRRGILKPNALIRQEGYHSFLEKRRQLRKKANGGSHTFGEWENLKAQFNWSCLMCEKREPNIKLTADHIVPISKGGSSNIENIQPLCRGCNSSKGNRVNAPF